MAVPKLAENDVKVWFMLFSHFNEKVSRQTRAGREVRRIVILHLLHRIELMTCIAVLMVRNAGLGGQAWMPRLSRTALLQGSSVFHVPPLKNHRIITMAYLQR